MLRPSNQLFIISVLDVKRQPISSDVYGKICKMKNRDLPTPSPQMGSEQKLTGGRELTEKCITFGEIGGCFNGGTRRGFYKKRNILSAQRSPWRVEVLCQK